MLLVGIVLFECLLAWIVQAILPWWCWALACVLYGIGYIWLDDGVQTGFRSWNKARSLSLWRWMLPVDVMYAGSEESIRNHRRPILYLMVNNVTHLPLVYTFGLRPLVTNCSVALPQLLFYFPLLRDVLLCLGGVGVWPGAKHRQQVIRTMHAHNRSVAMCASPSTDIFALARELDMFIVPVHVQGELQRYAFIQTPQWAITEYTTTRWGWTFPTLFATRILGRVPPSRLKVVIGSLMNPNTFKDDDDTFETFFKSQITNLSGALV